MTSFPERLIQKTFSLKEQSIIASWYLDAVAETRTFMKDRFFDVETAYQIRGDLENLAIDRAFQTMLERGAIKGTSGFQFYKRPTGKFLLMSVKETHLIHCRLLSPEDFPKHKRATYRDLLRSNNEEPQLDIFSLAQPMDSNPSSASLHLLMLTHGHIKGSGPFLNLSYPDVQRECFTYQSSNLLLIPHQVRDDLPKTALPDSDVGATLQQLLEENLEAHLILKKDNEQGR